MLPLYFLFFDFTLSLPTHTARKVWVCILHRLTVECALYPLILTMSLWHILHILQLRKVGCIYLPVAPQLKWPSRAVNPCPNQTRALELPAWLPLCSVSALLPRSCLCFPRPVLPVLVPIQPGCIYYSSALPDQSPDRRFCSVFWSPRSLEAKISI